MSNLNNNNSDEDFSGIQMVPDESRTYEPAPAGTHVARCVTFIQLGTQKTEFNGIPGRDRMKIVIGWELPEELTVFNEQKGEQPYCIQNVYNFVLGEKSTYKIHFEGWTGGRINRDFNPLSMVGKSCLLTIVHNPKKSDPSQITAKVAGIAALTKSQVCPAQLSKTKVLVFARWKEELFNNQPDWIKKAIEASPEYKSPPVENKESQYRKKETAPPVKEFNDLPY